VFYGNYVRNHARVTAVSVCERMDFRNKLVMESNHAFVDWECLTIEPIFRVGEKASMMQFAPSKSPFPNSDECQARFRTIPFHELVNRVTIYASSIWARETVQDCSSRVFEIGQAQDRFDLATSFCENEVFAS